MQHYRAPLVICWLALWPLVQWGNSHPLLCRFMRRISPQIRRLSGSCTELWQKKNGLKAFACVQCKPLLPVQGASKGCLADGFFLIAQRQFIKSCWLLEHPAACRVMGRYSLLVPQPPRLSEKWTLLVRTTLWQNFWRLLKKEANMNKLDCCCCCGCLGEFKSISSVSAPISPSSQHAY